MIGFFSSILDYFLGDIIYLRFDKNIISARSVKSKTQFDDKPLIALNEGRVFSIGKEVENLSEIMTVKGNKIKFEIINLFNHPRLLAANFEATSLAFGYFYQKASGRRHLVQPIVICHPLDADKLEGGISEVEIRFLEEICRDAGARKVLIWIGDELSDEEAEQLIVLPEGKVYPLKNEGR